MLDPSSSEEESENETVEDENSDVLSLPSQDQRSLSASGDNLSAGGSQGYPSGYHLSRSNSARASSPSPSQLSERQRHDYDRHGGYAAADRHGGAAYDRGGGHAGAGHERHHSYDARDPRYEGRHDPRQDPRYRDHRDGGHMREPHARDPYARDPRYIYGILFNL